jgi:hypothetical protein
LGITLVALKAPKVGAVGVPPLRLVLGGRELGLRPKRRRSIGESTFPHRWGKALRRLVPPKLALWSSLPDDSLSALSWKVGAAVRRGAISLRLSLMRVVKGLAAGS